MANMMKFTKMQALAVIAHQERTCLTHSNENIDPDRLQDNYCVWPLGNPDPFGEKHGWRRLMKRVSEVKHINRSDVNVLVEWVIHLGVDVPPGFANEMKFFEACMEYCAMLYGAENICYGIVHKDEEHPHLTVGFVPVVKKELKLRDNASAKTKAAYEAALAAGNTMVETLDADSVITRRHLIGWHGGLAKHLVERLGYDPAVLTGVTKALGGNVPTKTMKRKSRTWREQRNKKAQQFHEMRRAAKEQRKAALDAQIGMAKPKTQEWEPKHRNNSLDDLLNDAKNSGGRSQW